MNTALRAGLQYFGAVFALGFVLGTIRVLLLAPTLGEAGAVIVELPFMLAASFLLCGAIIRRQRLGAALAARLTMGACAFACLMAAEFALAVLAFGQTPSGFLAALASTPGLLGLAGQVIFGLMPLFVERTAS